MRTLVTGMLSAAVLVVGIGVAQAAPVSQIVTGYSADVAKASEQVSWRRYNWYPRYFHRHHRHHRFFWR